MKQDAADGFALLISGNQLSDTALRNVRLVVLRGIDAPKDGGSMGKAIDRDLEQLKKASDLQTLRIYATGVTDAGLAQLSHLKHLRVVESPSMRSTDEKLKVLAEFPALEELLIERSDITKVGAESISRMKRLNYLDLSYCKIDTSFFERHPLPLSITHLALSKTNVDARIVQFLPPGITHLSLYGTKVDDSIIPNLLKLKQLKVLNIEGLTHKGLETVEKGLPNTKVNDIAFITF
ncbi:hypothetical protein GC197_12990 [bacterium]|nr:hypothetical protein [bacterium]